MAEVPDVPSIFDYAKTDEQRQLMRFVFSSTEFGRPYLFPPDVPEERVQLMRKAIAERGAGSRADRRSREDQARHDLSGARAPGAAGRQLYETPPALIETVKKLVPNLR